MPALGIVRCRFGKRGGKVTKFPEFRESGLFFKVILYKNKKEFEQVIPDIENGRLRDNRQTSWEPSPKTSPKILEIMKKNQLITIQDLCITPVLSLRAKRSNLITH